MTIVPIEKTTKAHSCGRKRDEIVRNVFLECDLFLTCRSFSIVNPTSQFYSFQWVCEDEADPKKPVSFQCLQPKGQIRSGKKTSVGLSTRYTYICRDTFKHHHLLMFITFVLRNHPVRPSVRLS